MKIDNKTKYDGRYLRRLFLACEKHCFEVYLKHSHPKHRHVTIKYHKTSWIGGYAWYNSCSIVMKLPHPTSTHLGKIKTKNEISARKVAQVYLHELGHNLGRHHNQMGRHNDIDVSWWPDEIIPLKKVITKPKPNLIEVRASKTQKKLDEWQKKFNRAKTLVRKYQSKVRYYEKKAAASK